MKTLLKNIQSGLVISIVFIFTVGLFCIVYAATLDNPSTATNGSSLSSTEWNKMVTKLSKFGITDTGNVGIGIAIPGQKLSVAGIVESTSGGFKFPDGITKSEGTLNAANMIRSDGGTGNGSSVNMLTLTLDLTGKEGKWIHIYGGTAIAEDSNTANASIIRLIINNGTTATTVSALRQGIAVYQPWDANSIASLSTQGYFKITSAYAISGVTIKLNGGIDNGAFHWGDQPSYTSFDGENAGGYLGYAIF